MSDELGLPRVDAVYQLELHHKNNLSQVPLHPSSVPLARLSQLLNFPSAVAFVHKFVFPELPTISHRRTPFALVLAVEARYTWDRFC